jgi:hypothetical protein
VYDRIYDTLRAAGILQTFRGVHDSTLIALDGTWYHASHKIHCPACSRLEPKSLFENSITAFRDVRA